MRRGERSAALHFGALWCVVVSEVEPSEVEPSEAEPSEVELLSSLTTLSVRACLFIFTAKNSFRRYLLGFIFNFCVRDRKGADPALAELSAGKSGTQLVGYGTPG